MSATSAASPSRSVAGWCPPTTPGEPLADGRLERRAARLHVFMDGLTLQAALYSPEFSAAEVREALRRELESLSRTDEV